MDRSGVQRWLDRYIAAWRANEPEPIEALFTDDVVYRYRLAEIVIQSSGARLASRAAAGGHRGAG